MEKKLNLIKKWIMALLLVLKVVLMLIMEQALILKYS